MSSNKSQVWESFKKMSSDQAQCNICFSKISTKGGNTTGMKNHLKKHSIAVKSKMDATTIVKDEQKISIIKKCTLPGVLPFVCRESLEEILSKCAARDGISFNSIVKCEAIRGYVTNRNYKMPTSSSTVRKYVMKFYEDKKHITMKYLDSTLKIGGRFSITVDEWTDIAMRRYLNISLQTSDKQTVLGLVPIVECCTSEKTEELVFQRLYDFGVDFTRDIVASTHDGASVMVKYGRLISAEAQCCYNHAIHLSVVEIFYKDIKETSCGHSLEDFSADSEEEDANNSSDNETYNKDLILESEIPEFCTGENHKIAIDEMRKIIKFFRKSSIRTEVLLGHVKKNNGKPLRLLLDVKTRWSSLVTAIVRFLKLINSINDALEELGATPYSQNNIRLLKETTNILEPVKLGVLEMSKQTANLLTAEATLIYIFKELDAIKTPLAMNFLKSLRSRIYQRRNQNLTSVLFFLHHGVYPKINENEYFSYSPKQLIKTTAMGLMERLYPIQNNLQQHAECSNDKDLQQGVHNQDEISKLQKCIATFIDPRSNSSYSNQLLSIDKEFKLLIANNGKRTSRLELLYQALLSVKPTSTASERVFSVAGNFMTSLRNRMNTDTLNALIFLKYYFMYN